MKNFLANHPEIKSAIYTFLTGFVLAIGAGMQTIDASNLTKGAIFALIVAGIRAGIKLLGEQFLAPKE